MIDRLTDLLTDLGKIFQIPLSLDKYNACSIQIPPITIQLQLDATEENLFLFSKIIELPPGRFRENVLCEALKANAGPDPRTGIFGYVAQTNHLSLHQSYPLSILNAERLSGLFGAFFEMGESWHNSIQNGQIAPVSATTSRPSPFGIRP